MALSKSLFILLLKVLLWQVNVKGRKLMPMEGKLMPMGGKLIRRGGKKNEIL